MLYPSFANHLEKKYARGSDIKREVDRIIHVQNTNGKQLEGWLFEKPKSFGTIIVASGNAMGLRQAYYYSGLIFGSSKIHARVLLMSYQGFGENQGSADLESIPEDIYAFSREIRRLYPDEPILIFGESIGAAGAICSQAKYKSFDAILVEGLPDTKGIPYTKARDLWFLYPIGLPIAAIVSADVPKNMDVSKCIEEFDSVPMVFIHDKEDKITPYEAAKNIFDKYQGSKYLVEPDKPTSSPHHLNLSKAESTKESLFDFIKNVISNR
jgi:hypothetical protein